MPYERQFIEADRDRVVEELVYRQDQFYDRVTTRIGREADRIVTRSAVRLSIELNGVTFEDRALDRMVVLSRVVEVQDDDAVTTVCIHERIAVFACCRDVTTTELESCSFADGLVNRGVGRVVDYQFEAVEHTIVTDVCRVVTINAGGVERSNL